MTATAAQQHAAQVQMAMQAFQQHQHLAAAQDPATATTAPTSALYTPQFYAAQLQEALKQREYRERAAAQQQQVPNAAQQEQAPAAPEPKKARRTRDITPKLDLIDQPRQARAKKPTKKAKENAKTPKAKPVEEDIADIISSAAKSPQGNPAQSTRSKKPMGPKKLILNQPKRTLKLTMKEKVKITFLDNCDADDELTPSPIQAASPKAKGKKTVAAKRKTTTRKTRSEAPKTTPAKGKGKKTAKKPAPKKPAKKPAPKKPATTKTTTTKAAKKAATAKKQAGKGKGPAKTTEGTRKSARIAGESAA